MSAPLYVDTSGEGPPVVMLHSSGLSGRQWQRLASALTARGFRAVAPDFTGHGRSAPWPEPTPFSYLGDVAAIADLLRAEGPVHLVGHSYGGFIAALAALAAPGTVRTMTLSDPVSFGVLDADRDASAKAELRAVDVRWGTSQAEHDSWLSAFVDYWGGNGAWLALREDARAEFRRVGWVVHEAVTTLVGDATSASAYELFPSSVTLITGERSPLAARTVVKRLGEAFTDVKVVTVPGVGHMGPMTHADRVNDIVLATLR